MCSACNKVAMICFVDPTLCTLALMGDLALALEPIDPVPLYRDSFIDHDCEPQPIQFGETPKFYPKNTGWIGEDKCEVTYFVGWSGIPAQVSATCGQQAHEEYVKRVVYQMRYDVVGNFNRVCPIVGDTVVFPIEIKLQ